MCKDNQSPTNLNVIQKGLAQSQLANMIPECNRHIVRYEKLPPEMALEEDAKFFRFRGGYSVEKLASKQPKKKLVVHKSPQTSTFPQGYSQNMTKLR